MPEGPAEGPLTSSAEGWAAADPGPPPGSAGADAAIVDPPLPDAPAEVTGPAAAGPPGAASTVRSARRRASPMRTAPRRMAARGATAARRGRRTGSSGSVEQARRTRSSRVRPLRRAVRRPLMITTVGPCGLTAAAGARILWTRSPAGAHGPACGAPRRPPGPLPAGTAPAHRPRPGHGTTATPRAPGPRWTRWAASTGERMTDSTRAPARAIASVTSFSS